VDEEYMDEDSSHRQSSVVITLTVDDRDEGIDSELKLEPVLEDESILDEDGSDEDMARLED
jgi:hypothetical protein